ncbi:uncharacterized protein KLLA0_F27709g [Kluyveromyces lactis]|uniref:RING-type E3 ubiquitin transferase n=1 Tax=Kluyveromyces lactis (strain ATCC 8585 / CBS 2359 / DSM 70799 / NBRC 1267 / NRRL Y-1140 / WM37) TaxID=284590 RepID=Q6CIC6_KLULA|nr:uncharacterized protein KLLA0_F27709g [Kluyveromyces lactis]CAG99021.1 KLLA0F27709p [Kluyveromyces lactis]|eukprot:XP_456313.1 uncharacterized protein KLLA0_F27709g [Kluyveromyces lactis]
MSSSMNGGDHNYEDKHAGNFPTCRICMLEGTSDNPLFHPCKCKGSIKYIHQLCLIEWLQSKHVDVTKPGAGMVCSICNHPIAFQTLYDESMPEKIPLLLLLKHSVFKIFGKLNHYFKFTLIAFLFFIGIPLSWNIWGKLYTATVDDFSFPSNNKWYINLIYGFERNIPKNPTTTDILYQLVINYRFSLLQILMVLIVHAIAYLQYDMVVREPIFNKMILHKIGPRFSKQELAMQSLRERFPNMDPNDISMLINALNRQRQDDPNEDDTSEDEQEQNNFIVNENNDEPQLAN